MPTGAAALVYLQTSDVILMRGEDCYVSISPGDASDKTDVNDAAVQTQIINKLTSILSCLP